MKLQEMSIRCLLVAGIVLIPYGANAMNAEAIAHGETKFCTVHCVADGTSSDGKQQVKITTKDFDGKKDSQVVSLQSKTFSDTECQKLVEDSDCPTGCDYLTTEGKPSGKTWQCKKPIKSHQLEEISPVEAM